MTQNITIGERVGQTLAEVYRTGTQYTHGTEGVYVSVTRAHYPTESVSISLLVMDEHGIMLNAIINGHPDDFRIEERTTDVFMGFIGKADFMTVSKEMINKLF